LTDQPLRLVETQDQSFTLYNSELEEHYHSIHGAITESQHVFIKNGFVPLSEQKTNLSILEVGLGTCLNLLLTYLESQQNKIKVEYTAVEPFPISQEIFDQLNYEELLQLDKNDSTYHNIFYSEWNCWVNLNSDFRLQKLNSTIQQSQLLKDYDLIYFDAFAPNTQPKMWSSEVFQQLYDVMNKNGLLVTYCAKGEVKRTLKKVGFEIESLSGPPGKREMTRATKC